MSPPPAQLHGAGRALWAGPVCLNGNSRRAACHSLGSRRVTAVSCGDVLCLELRPGCGLRRRAAPRFRGAWRALHPSGTGPAMASGMAFHSLFFTLAVGAALPLLGADTARAELAPSMDQSTTPASTSPTATATGAGPDTAAETASSSAGTDGRWQASVYGSWMPGIGEAKRGALDGGPPGGAPGYGIRLEKGLHDWWSAGLMLSSRTWEIDAPQAATGLLWERLFSGRGGNGEISAVALQLGGWPSQLVPCSRRWPQRWPAASKVTLP